MIEEPELPEWAWKAYQESIEERSKEEEEILRLIEQGEYYTEEKIEEAIQSVEEEKERVKKETLEEFEKKKQRSFDELVDRYRPLVSLHGRSYHVPTKFVFYSLLSNCLKYNKFAYGNQKLDLRIPILVMAEAGTGKKNYADFIKRTVEGLRDTYCEPTSYHAEQFVGTINIYQNKRDEEERYEQIPGYLAEDFIVIDEAHKLLSEAGRYDETLKYIRIALDTIGRNRIQKRLVKVPPEYQLEYYPDCNIVLLSQPLSGIDPDLIITGTLRRFVTVYIRLTDEERLRALTKDKFLVPTDEGLDEIWEEWLKFCKGVKERQVEFAGDIRDFQEIDVYIKRKLQRVKASGSIEAKKYLEANLFTAKQMIFRMAIIRATVETSRDVVTIEKRHIMNAIKDFDLVLERQIEWVSQQMVFMGERPMGWREIHEEIMKLLGDQEEMTQSNIVRMIHDKHSEKTRQSRVSKALKDLQRWQMIESRKEGRRKYYRIIENR